MDIQVEKLGELRPGEVVRRNGTRDFYIVTTDGKQVTGAVDLRTGSSVVPDRGARYVRVKAKLVVEE